MGSNTMGLRIYESEEERREVRKWRRKELEEYKDRFNAYYFGYANLPTCKEARHLRYMENRDRILAYMKRRYEIYRNIILACKKEYYEVSKDRILAHRKRYYQMKKKKDYFMKKGFLNKHVKVHEYLQVKNAV